MHGLSWDQVEKNLSSLVQEIQEESPLSKEGGRRRKRELYGRLGQEEKAAAGGFEAGGGENRRQLWVVDLFDPLKPFHRLTNGP